MQNRWNDDEAATFVDRYAATTNADIALRVYTSRLIGRDHDLVLHGGGNTSVKTTLPDRVHGTPIEVLCVKGSGWDLADIEPAGLPAVQLEPLRRLRGVGRLSDEEMVNQVRTRLLDASAPTPSVETLLHAFLPHRFVDHTHADPILVLTNQADGGAMLRDALGGAVAVLPWIMPGHPLAEAVADAIEAQPDVEGVVLMHHGIFTFGETARVSYDRMITLCHAAEQFAAQRARRGATVTVAGPLEAIDARLADVLPVVRGALAIRDDSGEVTGRWIADARCSAEMVRFSQRDDAAALCAIGPLTPDHVIRTKERYLFLTQAQATDTAAVQAAVEQYGIDYGRDFEAHRESVATPLQMLDPLPRVVVVEGLGVIGFGGDAKAARIAADIAEHTARGKALAQSIGEYRALRSSELFEMEYWSLEQAKLGTKSAPPLAGQIALLTGAGGAIGHGIADSLLAAGCHVFLTDVDEERLAVVESRLAARHGSARIATEPMDVTDPASVDFAFAECARAFGGLDVLVPNAGIAHVSTLRDMDDTAFQRTVAVNLDGVMRVLRAGARLFTAQASGGTIIVQASKNVFAPGAGFGAYSASKAGALQLARVAALELASIGVTVNAINADAVFGDEVPSGLWSEVGPERMKARGLDAAGLRDYYRDRSLLQREVRPEDVGRAVVFFAATATRTTGAVLPVDAGVAGAFPR